MHPLLSIKVGLGISGRSHLKRPILLMLRVGFWIQLQNLSHPDRRLLLPMQAMVSLALAMICDLKCSGFESRDLEIATISSIKARIHLVKGSEREYSTKNMSKMSYCMLH